MYDADGHKLQITLNVAMSASFDYWDEGNECPPVQAQFTFLGNPWDNTEGHNQWLQGGYPTVWGDISGMDFVLGGDAEDTHNQIVALEITKLLVDESGNLIHPDHTVTNTFDVWQNTSSTVNKNGVADINVEGYKQQETEQLYSGYQNIHSKQVTVGEEGMGLVYDYAVTSGMYYITEQHDANALLDEITDKDGNTWQYKNTRILTEYVRRGDQYDDKTAYPDPMHYSKEYVRTDPAYRSIPEVLGMFETLKGEQKKSGFVEYFVYNVYTKGTKLEVEKQWQPENQVPANAEVIVELQYRKRLIGHAASGQDPDSDIREIR